MSLRRTGLSLTLCLSTLGWLACSRSAELDDGRILSPEIAGAASSSGAADETESDPQVALDELPLERLIARSLVASDDGSATSQAVDPALIEALRGHGPAGLEALIAAHGSLPAVTAEVDGARRALIDAVASQRDASYGGLFWYRDLGTAQREAADSGKPVLSLRLLGDLGSEYSCANSRMFRTLLYADPELASWLADSFVLHWSSERPVPRVEIDFGNGRVVERTITGNSAHYVLDARGRVLDVVPGLWDRAAFRRALESSLALHTELAAITSQTRWREHMAAHHDAAFEASAVALRISLAQIRGDAPTLAAVRGWLTRAPGDGKTVATPALRAVPMAVTKARVERPILAANPGGLGGVLAGTAAEPALEVGPRDDREWLRVGATMTRAIELHRNSVAIIRAERPLEGLVPVEDQAQVERALLDTLRRSLQQDTGQNALSLHPRAHAELAARARDARSLGFADVNEWVYASLFQTPATDPWLGLIDPAIYTALDGAGLREAPSAAPTPASP